MVAQASYGSCLICENPKGGPMEDSTFRPLDDSRDPQIDLELLEDNDIDALHTLGVRTFRKRIWLYSLFNVYHLWQPDELHQLLLGLFKDLLHWLIKFLKTRNVKDQFDNRFTSVPQYPGLQHLSTPFD